MRAARSAFALRAVPSLARAWALTAVLWAGLAAAAADPVAIAELLRNARLWQSLERPDNQRLVLEKVLAIDVGQVDALLLLGELDLRAGKVGEARRRLQALRRQGARAAAAELQDLLRIYTRDLARLNQLRLVRRGGDERRALALAHQLFPNGRPPGALAEEFAGLLGGRSAAGAALAASGRRAPPRPGSVHAGTAATQGGQPAPPDEADTAAATYWPLLREARALRDAGRDAEAAQRLATARALLPTEAEGRLLAAELELRLGHSSAAEAGYRALLDSEAARSRAVARLVALLQGEGRHDEALAEAARQGAPGAIDAGALRAAADAQVAQGRPGVALRWLEDSVALLPGEPWLRHDLARLYARLGQPATGREVMAEGLAVAPADAAMRYAAALFHAAIDADTEALALLDTVPEAQRSEGQLELAARLRLAQVRRAEAAAAEQARARQRSEALALARRPTEEVALFPYFRHAAAGRSTLRGTELPLVLTRANGDDGTPVLSRRWLHVDAVRLSAGTLPKELDEAGLFGQVRAAGQALPADLPQHARGLSVGVGWSGEEQRWDLGVIGAGFEVPNLVGGWRRAFSVGGADAALELSRRVLTSSLLSYAGARDPASGQRWGGVTLNAVSLRLARDVGGFSTSVSLRAGLLAGHAVASNNTMQLRLAGDRDWLQGPALNLNAGLTLALWRYRRNLGFYTFGQGGYYSPQRYASLGLPLQVQGHFGGPWSYKVRGAVAHSWSFEADTPFYPTDAALQARAGNPVHDGGGSGGGWSGSLRADLERRLGGNWSAGASFIADRSAFFAPTQWLFYLRHGAPVQPGALPRPAQPYSQF